jgi:DsbC/DsbD-like thiol-disulfide interchange protein
MNFEAKSNTDRKRRMGDMWTPARGLALMLLVASLGWAQGANPVVEARSVTATDAVHADSVVKLAILAQVAAGFHINDHKPTLDYLIPTKLSIEPGDQFTVKSVSYPKGTPVKFAFNDGPLSVYEGQVIVGVLLQAGKTVPPGTYTLKTKFSYQACNDHSCLAPTSVPVPLTLKVVPSNVPLKPVESDVFKRIKFE